MNIRISLGIGVIFLFGTCNLISQNSFEGVIEYDVKFKMLEGFEKFGVSNDDFIKNLKSQGEYFSKVDYYYKGGNYAFETNLKNNIRKQIYVSKENNIYFFENDLVIVSDASIDLETVKGNTPKIQLLDKTELINNIRCNVVKVVWKLGTYYYYYNSEILIVDPNLFKGHNYDQFYRFLEISKSLPIRIVKEVNNLMVTELTLKKFFKKKIMDNVFDIPNLQYDDDLNKYAQPHQKVFVKN